MTTQLRTVNLTLKTKHKYLCCDLNLTMKSGEIWGFLGPNGCGKTTLLQNLAGTLLPHQGQIFLNEKLFVDYSKKELAQKIGILFQEMSDCLPQTVYQYCSGGRFPHQKYLRYAERDQQIINQSLTITELIEFSNILVNQLSSGEKKRLTIASLLTQMPEIYLLDEPTNHLDLRHQMILMNHLRKLSRDTNKLIVMCLHDINLAQQFCDYLLLLFPQGYALQGKTEEILTSQNLSKLYNYPIQQINHYSYWNAQ